MLPYFFIYCQSFKNNWIKYQHMKNIKFLFFLVFISYFVNAQNVINESSCIDSIGMAQDLNIISRKLGTISDTVRQKLKCLEIEYFGFDKNGNTDSASVRKGVLIVHETVSDDLKYIFQELKSLKFPIQSIIPVNKYGLNQDSSGWNDAASMRANNTSAFNYRLLTLSKDFSPHAFGTAVDINPMLNPYEKYVHDGKFLEPENAVYDLSKPGTISDGRIVGIFDQRGWVWGGRWNNPVDYQHFDLRKDRSRKHYLMKESTVKMFFSINELDGTLSIYDSKMDRKMERPSLTVQKSEFKNLEVCIDSFGIECLTKWQSANIKVQMPDAVSKLDGLKIEICVEDGPYKSWNMHCARLVQKKLGRAGADAFINTFKKHKSDLRISVGTGTGNLKVNDDFQIIFVPGAFTEKAMHHAQNRFDFLNLLVSEDLANSVKIAHKIQQSIIEKMKIMPLSRQLPGPNLLQDECIKTNIDGIYCRNMPVFSGHYCPQFHISLLSLDKAEEIFSQPKLGFGFCELLSEAILDGLSDYFENK